MSSRSSTSGSAPGRLDLLGGVADYSGALVLEVPTRRSTTVTAEPADAFVVGSATLSVQDVTELARMPYADVRAALASLPKSAHYMVGVAIVLVRHGVIAPPRMRLTVMSDVPQSVGVSSSAALEVATARALGANVDPLCLASLCQEAENHVVGAPCGIMDQVTVAAGTPGAIMPILCRPASIQPTVALPPDVEIVGWPTGAQHDVGESPYRRARAAAFMGKRIIEVIAGQTWAWVSELPRDGVDELPDTLDGATFLDRWQAVDDDLSTIDPAVTYPIRAATGFGVGEHRRSERALALLSRGDVDGLAPLLAASHADYDAMGLGHPAATTTVDQAMSRPGVIGARSSGGGSGGTIVVVCRRGSIDDVEGLIR